MKKDDLVILEQFHADCVRFWERELKVETDTCRDVYINALEDVKRITTNPFIPFNSPKLDISTKEYFVKRCEMDLGLNKDFASMEWVEDKVEMGVKVIEVSALTPYPNYMGGDCDNNDLEASVLKDGLYRPLTVTDYGMEDGKYMVVDGHRRLEVAKKLGLNAVPCTVVQFDNEDALLCFAVRANEAVVLK